MANIWTTEDIEFLINNYGILSRYEIAEKLNRTPKSVTHMINRKNLANASSEWSDNEIQIIKDNHATLTRNELSALLPNRSLQALSTKLWELKLVCTNFTRLDDTNDVFIRDNYLIKTDIAIANLLDMKEHQIAARRRYMNLYKSSNQVRGPTSIETIVSNYLDSKNIKYIYNTKLADISACPDFLILDKLIIEVNGDYWHGNPLLYKQEDLNDIQLRHVQRDIVKYRLYKKNGFKLLILWENDIKNCIDFVEKQIDSFISNTAPS